MKTTSLFAIISLALAGSAFAGVDYVEPKAVTYDQPIVDTTCYPAGFEFSGFAAGIFPEGGAYDDEIGGGVSLAYFYNENFGMNLSAAVYGTDSEIQNYTLDAVYRFPIGCVAPYVIAGGGVHTNGHTEGLFRFGGGVDFRVMEDFSLFADGTYNILGGDLADYTTARVGLRWTF